MNVRKWGALEWLGVLLVFASGVAPNRVKAITVTSSFAKAAADKY